MSEMSEVSKIPGGLLPPDGWDIRIRRVGDNRYLLSYVEDWRSCVAERKDVIERTLNLMRLTIEQYRASSLKAEYYYDEEGIVEIRIEAPLSTIFDCLFGELTAFSSCGSMSLRQILFLAGIGATVLSREGRQTSQTPQIPATANSSLSSESTTIVPPLPPTPTTAPIANLTETKGDM